MTPYFKARIIDTRLFILLINQFMEEKSSVNKSKIEKKMNVIISLLLKIANDGGAVSLKEQVRDLASFGLDSAEIAEITGKKVGHVSKELSVLKKESK